MRCSERHQRLRHGCSPSVVAAPKRHLGAIYFDTMVLHPADHVLPFGATTLPERKNPPSAVKVGLT